MKGILSECKCKLIINSLIFHHALRDYQSRIKMGIGFSDEEIKNDHMKTLCEQNRKQLIEARVLNGEPPDLNF